MAIRLSKLLENLPAGTEDRIKKAKDRWNPRIREALRRETRLSLQRRDDSKGKDDNIVVPVTVCHGLPDALWPKDDKIDEQYELALLLAPHRQVIVALATSSETAINELLPTLFLPQFAGMFPPDFKGELISVRKYAQFLLDKLKEFDLTKFVLEVNQDVLGVYRYRLAKRIDDPQSKIELYWGVIGLIARDLGIEPEQLTCVVLAHELAHAYTHLGSDADDEYWSTNGFSASAPDVVEGLAQYYGWLVCKRLDELLPGTLNAYDSLLKKQSGPYLAHKAWMKEFTAEHVRLAMLHTRRDYPKVAIDMFTESLKAARDHLPKTERAQVAKLQG
jgi:hypothetical protein